MQQDEGLTSRILETDLKNERTKREVKVSEAEVARWHAKTEHQDDAHIS